MYLLRGNTVSYTKSQELEFQPPPKTNWACCNFMKPLAATVAWKVQVHSGILQILQMKKQDTAEPRSVMKFPFLGDAACPLKDYAMPSAKQTCRKSDLVKQALCWSKCIQTCHVRPQRIQEEGPDETCFEPWTKIKNPDTRKPLQNQSYISPKSREGMEFRWSDDSQRFSKSLVHQTLATGACGFVGHPGLPPGNANRAVSKKREAKRLEQNYQMYIN